MANPSAYPLFLNLAQRPVLIVGGGGVGLRKARGLMEAAARVVVVSPAFDRGFDVLDGVERVGALYADTHMTRDKWRLVFAATNVRDVNARVQSDARAAGIFCCRCDEPEDSDFFGGAVERLGAAGKGQGSVVLAVSTCGASPALSARICRQASAAVDPVLPALANLLALWRAQAKCEVADTALRRSLLQHVAGTEMEATLRKEGEAAAAGLFQRWLFEARAGTLAMVNESGARSGEAVEHGD